MTYGTVNEETRARIDERIEVLTNRVDALTALDDSGRGPSTYWR